MTLPSAAVIVISRPSGAAPCETQGSNSTPSRLTPTAPLSYTRSPRKSAPPDEELKCRLGRERVGIGQEQDAARPLEAWQPDELGRRLLVVEGRLERRLVDELGVKRRSGASLAEGGRPHRHRGAALELAATTEHAARAAADERAGGQLAVDALERRFGCDQVRPADEDHREVGGRTRQLARRVACGLGAGPKRIRLGGEPGADPNAHRSTILPLMPRAEVIALFGPTGVGKTDVAIELARLLSERGENPVAVSADALQVYQGLEILTGAAGPRERAQLEHRLLSFLPVDASFSAGQYAELAHAEIDGLLAVGARPIVVGGTGLYLRAALAELNLRPPPPEGARERRLTELERRGAPALHRVLRARAPWAAADIDPSDRQRIVRALELLDAGELEPHAEDSQLWTDEMRHSTLLIGIVLDREQLYARIDARVDAMVAAGAQDEVRQANAAGASPTARKALGFEELLTGDIESMKRRTRNYARRQLTWMPKLAAVHTIDMTGRSPADVAREVLELWLGTDG